MVPIASLVSFDTIVASGVRSAMPHGVASTKVIEKGDLITLDFGCYYEGYVSDMTRTFALGDPGEKLKEIHQESSEFYSRVKFDCKSKNQVAQKICKSQEHKLIAEVQLRTGIYDYENATHTELTGNAYKSEYGSSFEWITRRYDNCSQLKSSLIEIMSTSIWAN